MLDRLGLKDNVRKSTIGTTVLRRVLRPQDLHDAQRFIGATPTLGEREAEGLEFDLRPAYPCSEDQTAFTELVTLASSFASTMG